MIENNHVENIEEGSSRQRVHDSSAGTVQETVDGGSESEREATDVASTNDAAQVSGSGGTPSSTGRVKPSWKLTDEQKNELVTLYESGQSATQIGQRFCIGTSCVTNILRVRSVLLRTYNTEKIIIGDVPHRHCTVCRYVRPYIEFRTTESGSPKGTCQKCEREKNKRHRDKMSKTKPDVLRDFVWGKCLKRLGITPERYKEMFDGQNGLCAVCGREEKILRKDGSRQRLAVDHNHSTGEVRQLLCKKCNAMLGHANDNPTILRNAAAYLEKHTHA